jgi:hypothetical protein
MWRSGGRLLIGWKRAASKPPRSSKDFCYEKDLEKSLGGKAWDDVWKRDYFGWENKKPGRSLIDALTQLRNYAPARPRPKARAPLGAHYTDAETIDKLIKPLITEPLLAEWAIAKARNIESLASAALKKVLPARALKCAKPSRRHSLPFKGRAGVGMGQRSAPKPKPIPLPASPLKREEQKRLSPSPLAASINSAKPGSTPPSGSIG